MLGLGNWIKGLVFGDVVWGVLVGLLCGLGLGVLDVLVICVKMGEKLNCYNLTDNNDEK